MYDADPSLSPGVSSTISDTPIKSSSSNFMKIKTENASDARSVSAKPQVARRNERERNRVRQVNNGFVTLRNHIPSTNSKNKKLSKVETLRAAASYIQHLQQLLDADHFSTNINGQSMPNLLAQTLQSYAAVSSHDHQSSPMAHFGGSMVQSSVGHHPNYYNANFVPPNYVDGHFSNHYNKVNPSNVSPQNGYVSDPGYDYVLSPPEIKQYHSGDFTVMQSYS